LFLNPSAQAFNIVNKAKNGKEISIVYVSNTTSKMTILTNSVQCLLATVHYKRAHARAHTHDIYTFAHTQKKSVRFQKQSAKMNTKLTELQVRYCTVMAVLVEE
jgi:hypothetical protein